MKLLRKTEYACVVMMQLAEEYGKHDPLSIRRIATDHALPPRVVGQILLQLKEASLVTSTLGAWGGYRLRRQPAKITLAEVIEAVGDDVAAATYTGKNTHLVRAFQQLFHELENIQRGRLRRITLAYMVQQARQLEPAWHS